MESFLADLATGIITDPSASTQRNYLDAHYS